MMTASRINAEDSMPPAFTGCVPDSFQRPAPTVVGAKRRLQSLHAAGHPVDDLARHTGLAAQTVEDFITGPTDPAALPALAPDTLKRVAAVFDHLQMIPGHDRHSQRRGENEHWPLPLDWDEDRIDDITYTTTRSGRPDRSSHNDVRRRIADARRKEVDGLRAKGWTINRIAKHLRVTPRTVWRDLENNTRVDLNP